MFSNYVFCLLTLVALFVFASVCVWQTCFPDLLWFLNTSVLASDISRLISTSPAPNGQGVYFDYKLFLLAPGKILERYGRGVKPY